MLPPTASTFSGVAVPCCADHRAVEDRDADLEQQDRAEQDADDALDRAAGVELRQIVRIDQHQHEEHAAPGSRRCRR